MSIYAQHICDEFVACRSAHAQSPLGKIKTDEHGGDDYGKKLKVAFLKRIRGEIKFASLDELTKRIREDAALAREAARS